MDPIRFPGIAATGMPAALAGIHRDLDVGTEVELALDGPGPAGAALGWTEVVEGAGFGVIDERLAGTGSTLVARRERTLPDHVDAGMRLLLCGLNPSIYSADAGAGFARPGNRFWPALRAAGLTDVDRDPARLLRDDRIGMTDLVKRATRRADELSADEFRAGIGRIERLAAWLEPALVVMVGLGGWRVAVDRTASAGLQERELGGRPVYVMPNPSGLNAHSRPEDFEAHFRAAAELAAG